ncbi:MAG TPA: GNAT family N-acetyltransferase [Thermomicrobiales bacterium]|nr:GNAT family N-acetyltransferase [Thermomicrobiales bacterium]
MGGLTNEIREPAVEVVPLTPADLPALGSTGNPRIDVADMRAMLEAAPGRSFWVPDTAEFILVQAWRNREELPSIHTLWSFTGDDALIRAAADAAQRLDAAALVMLETGERRSPTFYHRHGFVRIETIRTYEHVEPEVLARQIVPGSQSFSEVTLNRPDLLTAVIEIDHHAFPWFWWNSEAEFDTYLQQPGVEVWAGLRDGEVVSYIGITSFHHWAHLDRIAVDPMRQGQGLGRSAVTFAAERMLGAGARRIGLSTQGSNRVSRHLYESLGFQHTRQSDYDVFGIVFDADRVYRAARRVLSSDESGS